MLLSHRRRLGTQKEGGEWGLSLNGTGYPSGRTSQEQIITLGAQDEVDVFRRTRSTFKSILRRQPNLKS